MLQKILIEIQRYIRNDALTSKRVQSIFRRYQNWCKDFQPQKQPVSSRKNTTEATNSTNDKQRRRFCISIHLPCHSLVLLRLFVPCFLSDDNDNDGCNKWHYRCDPRCSFCVAATLSLPARIARSVSNSSKPVCGRIPGGVNNKNCYRPHPPCAKRQNTWCRRPKRIIKTTTTTTTTTTVRKLPFPSQPWVNTGYNKYKPFPICSLSVA